MKKNGRKKEAREFAELDAFLKSYMRKNKKVFQVLSGY